MMAEDDQDIALTGAILLARAYFLNVPGCVWSYNTLRNYFIGGNTWRVSVLFVCLHLIQIAYALPLPIVTYRFARQLQQPRLVWRWVTCGALAGSVLLALAWL